MPPEFPIKPARPPFDRHLVFAYRIESGEACEERFCIWEIDLPNDDLGPRQLPEYVPEAQTRARLTQLGLTDSEIEERLAWARKGATTLVLPPGSDLSAWRPPKLGPKTFDELLTMLPRGLRFKRQG